MLPCSGATCYIRKYVKNKSKGAWLNVPPKYGTRCGDQLGEAPQWNGGRGRGRGRGVGGVGGWRDAEPQQLAYVMNSPV